MINKLLALPLDCFFSCQSVPLNTNANSLIRNSDRWLGLIVCSNCREPKLLSNCLKFRSTLVKSPIFAREISIFSPLK